MEVHILSLLICRPDLLYRLDRGLQEASLNRMSVDDFGYTDHQVLFQLVRQSLEQDVDDPDHYLHANLPASLESLVNDLEAKLGQLDPVDDRLLEDLFRAVLKIRRTAMTENINELRFLQEEAQQSGDTRTVAYREMVQQYSMSLRGFDQAKLKLNGHNTERK